MDSDARSAVTAPMARTSPWWHRKTALASMVSAVAASLLGLFVYLPQNSTTGGNTNPGQGATNVVEQLLAQGKPSIVEFGANNCVSCREMKPILHALTQDPRIAVADVDILKERGYISKYQIRLMPTQVFFNAQGEEIGRHMGKISGAEILAHLGVANLDSTALPDKP